LSEIIACVCVGLSERDRSDPGNRYRQKNRDGGECSGTVRL